MDRLGPYELRAELGRGAMGIVYRGRRADLDRDVAVKVLPLGASPDLAARFRREAKLAARLRHPNIVGVHDVGEADGRLYLAMDLVDGQSLDNWLEDGRFTIVEAATLLQQLAHAVHHAHAQGVLHRDIKPGNVLIDGARVPYLADFGLARAVDTQGSAQLSRSGSVLGTPAYMSPEQAQGKPLDGRTDVWALGVMGYELLADLPPFKGDTAVQVLAEVCTRDARPLRRAAPDVPRDLEAIIHRCLERNLDARYPTAAALADDLGAFLAGRPVAARRVTVWRRASAWVRRNRALAATAAAGVLGIAAVAGYAFGLRPALARAARTSHLEAVQRAAAAGAQAEAARLAAALQALTGADGLATDAERVAALERDARPEAVAERLRAALPEGARPAPGDGEADAAFARGLAAFAAAPLQARAALLRGEPALAYRLDPTGDVGLAAAVQVARRIADERRLDPAAELLTGLRSRFPDRPIARVAAGLLAAVRLEQGDWAQALAAAADAGDAAEVPPAARQTMALLGGVRQEVAVPARGEVPYPYHRRAEPLRVAHLRDGRRLIHAPQRPGWPVFAVDATGRLAPAPSPLAALAPGTWVVDAAAGDVDGDGTVDLLAAVHRPGHGSGVAVLTARADGWSLRAELVEPASSPTHLVAGDADGDGRLEALVVFHWDAGAQWLVHWDPAAGRLVRRDWSPPASRPWVRGGLVGDLDGDGVPELVVGTSVHTSGEGLIYRWREDRPPDLLGRFPLFEPGDLRLVPDPEHPVGRLLACTSEVGITDLQRRHLRQADAPEDDGIVFVRWTGTEAAVVGRTAVSRGDPDQTELGSMAEGTLDGRPALLFWADRNAVDPRKAHAEGRRLRVVFGDPTGPPLVISLPRYCAAIDCLDVDGDGESELLALAGESIAVLGRRTAPPPPLALAEGEAPTANEALQRLRAARDLIAFGAADAARALLAEVAERFPGTPEAVEADRLQLDGLLAIARRRLDEARTAIARKQPGSEPALAEAADGFRRAAAEARAFADRYAGDPARRRRFLLAGADAAAAALDWDGAAALLGQALAESPGADDQRELAGWHAGLRAAAACHAPDAVSVGLDDPDVPWAATEPGRVERLPDGGVRVELDSHHGPGVLGIPVRWHGGAMRGRCVLELDGSAWSASLRVGLVPRGPDAVERGGTYVHLWLHGVVQWTDQSASLGLDTAGVGFAPGGYVGRWELRWACLPDAGQVVFEVLDPESGRLLCQQQARLVAPVARGEYVLGLRFGNRGGDCFLAHGLHPFATSVTVHALRMWAPPGRLEVDRAEPVGAAALVEVAGGLVLAGQVEQAAAAYERALAMDPGHVPALCGLALVRDRQGHPGDGVAPLVRAVRGAPYLTAVWLEDLGRVAPADERRRVGRLLRGALAALAGDDADTLLARALCLSLLGDLDTAHGLLQRVAATGRDDTALRYLRRRNHWGPLDPLYEDWRWLDARRVVLPGTEPPVVCWAPPVGAAPGATRAGLGAAWREFQGVGGMAAAMRCWVAACRQLTEEPDDADALAVRAQVGLRLQRHGMAERDFKRRARVLADDPRAALLVAQIYAVRKARDETLTWLEAAVQRGVRWHDVDREIQDQLAYLEGDPRYAAAVAAAGGG